MEDTPAAEDKINSGKRKRSPRNLVDVPIPLSLPRKPVGASDCWTVPAIADAHPLPKRPRLPTSKGEKTPDVTFEHLSDAVLQHIFSYVDPVALARLSRTTRRIAILLGSTGHLPNVGQKQHDDLYALRSPDSVWATSRRRYLPAMPKPLKDLPERVQFALTFGKKCQFCTKTLPPSASEHTNQWKSGPGDSSTRAIWPFRMRGCGACILQRTRKVKIQSLPCVQQSLTSI